MIELVFLTVIFSMDNPRLVISDLIAERYLEAHVPEGTQVKRPPMILDAHFDNDVHQDKLLVYSIESTDDDDSELEKLHVVA